jgi:carboxymethylenebutenolidase
MTDNQPLGFLAGPDTDPRGRVLVLHAWWGLNDTIRAFCRRLANAGHTAFAPDLYHGKVADTIPGAETLRDAFDAGQAREDIARAVSFLSRQPGPNDSSLAAIGFSLGAYFAFDVSITHPEQVRSVVSFYGAGEGDFRAAKAAYLGHFAEHDDYEPQEYIDGLEASLRAAGRPVTFHQYPDTGHWFAESDRTDAYDETASELAWSRTLEFLSRSPD